MAKFYEAINRQPKNFIGWQKNVFRRQHAARKIEDGKDKFTISHSEFFVFS